MSAPFWNRRKFLSSLLLGGCTPTLQKSSFDHGTPFLENHLRIKYYSVGCFLVTYKGLSFLSDPFWSHPSFWTVTFGKTVPNPKMVQPYLSELSSVRAVLVSHTHYDHVLDLPLLNSYLAEDAQIIGSNTLIHTFATTSIDYPFVSVNDTQSTATEKGYFIYLAQKRIRILPIKSSHPPHVGKIHLYNKKLDEDRKKPPYRSWDYQEGITLAFLIDFMDEHHNIKKRVYLQTSTQGYPSGTFPSSIRAEHPIDVALLGIDCATIKYENKPSIIDFLRPKNVIFCHWEDFFRRKDQPPKPKIKADIPTLQQYFSQQQSSRFLFPYWDRVFYL